MNQPIARIASAITPCCMLITSIIIFTTKLGRNHIYYSEYAVNFHNFPGKDIRSKSDGEGVNWIKGGETRDGGCYMVWG